MNTKTQNTENTTFFRAGVVEVIAILINIFFSGEIWKKFWNPLLKREAENGNLAPVIDPNLFHWNKGVNLPINTDNFKSVIYLIPEALSYTKIFEEADKNSIKKIYQPQEACEIALQATLTGQVDVKETELNIFYWDNKVVKKIRVARHGDGRLRIYSLDVDFNDKHYKCLANKTHVAFG